MRNIILIFVNIFFLNLLLSHSVQASRPPALLDLVGGIQNRLYVDDYVTDPNNARQGIQNAINTSAYYSGNTEIIFGNKTYLVDGNISVSDNKDNLQLRGVAGTKILKTTHADAIFTFYAVDNIIVDQLALGLNFEPYSVSTVTAKSGNTITVQAEAGYLAPNADFITNAPENWGYFVEPDATMALNTKITYNVNSATLQSGNEYKITLAQSIAAVKVGQKFIRNGRYNGNALVNVRQSNQVTFKNVELLNSTAGGFNVANSGAINFHTVSATLGAGKVRTLNADFLHMKHNRYGPWMSDSTIEGIGDDIINVSQRPTYLMSAADSNTSFILESGYDAAQYKVGDNLIFFNHKAGKVLAKRKVTSVSDTYNVWDEATQKYNLRVTVHINAAFGNASFLGSAEPTTLINNSFTGGKIKDSSFSKSRRYGLLNRYKYMKVINNEFSDLGSSAVAMYNENGVASVFTENPFPSMLYIANNKFKNNGRVEKYFSDPQFAQISIFISGATVPAYQVYDIKDSSIVRNTFEDIRKQAIFIANTSDSRIWCNRFTNYLASPVSNKPNVVSESNHSLLFKNNIIENSQTYWLDNNSNESENINNSAAMKTCFPQ